MVSQQDVLAFIKKQTERGHGTAVPQVRDEFSVSGESAAGHLRRLWRERLIETVAPRPSRFRFRLEPGEQIRDLRFRLTARGQQRLRWYELEQNPDNGLPFFR
jgi:hypothetical protein